MNDSLKKHVRRLPLYVFVFGMVALILYIGSVWDVEKSPGRTFAVFLMVPFYVGCVTLLSLVVWLIARFFK